MSVFILPPSPLREWGWEPPNSGQIDAFSLFLSRKIEIGGWGQVLFRGRGIQK